MSKMGDDVEIVNEGNPYPDVPVRENDKPERMLQWFAYDHLPSHLQTVSGAFANLAKFVVSYVDPSPERTVALRYLLEAKDAAVRAVIKPGA